MKPLAVATTATAAATTATAAATAAAVSSSMTNFVGTSEHQILGTQLLRCNAKLRQKSYDVL